MVKTSNLDDPLGGATSGHNDGETNHENACDDDPKKSVRRVLLSSFKYLYNPQHDQSEDHGIDANHAGFPETSVFMGQTISFGSPQYGQSMRCIISLAAIL